MKERLESLEQALEEALSEAGTDVRGVEDVRVRFLGKKGSITALMKELGRLDPSERPAAGQAINRIKKRAA